MKRLLVFLPLLLASCASHPKFKEISFLPEPPQGKGIKSMVYTREHYYDYKDPKRLTNKDSVRISYKSNRPQREVYYHKGDSTITEHYYNPDGLLLKSAEYNNGQPPQSWQEWEYDGKGNATAYRIFENGALSVKKNYTYDRYGNKLTERFLNTKGGSSSTTYFTVDYRKRTVIQKKDYNQIGKHTGYHKCYYDEKGYIIKVETYVDDVMHSRYEYEFDSHNYPISEKSDGAIKAGYINTYDERGNIILIEGYKGSTLQERTRYYITYE